MSTFALLNRLDLFRAKFMSEPMQRSVYAMCGLVRAGDSTMPNYTLEVREKVGERKFSHSAWRHTLIAANSDDAWELAAEALQFEEPGTYGAVLLDEAGLPTGPWRTCAKPIWQDRDLVLK